MKNLFSNIKFSGSDITSSDLKDLNKVIKSGWLAHGEKTEVFELKFSEYTNSKYSIAVSSCTSGLYILAKLADFKKGDIVLVPSVTHTATAHAIKLTGAKVKDEFTLDPKLISRGDADMAAMLGIDKDRAIQYNRNVFMTVNEVKTMEPANIDVALYDKIYGAGEVKTEEEFRKKVSEELNKMFVQDTDRVFKKEVSSTLIKKLKLKLPDAFLKKWILSSNKEATKEQIEKEYEMYSDNLKWQLIENNIIKDQKIKVEGEELLNHTMQLIGSQYAQYNMMIPAEDELKKAAQNVLGNQEEARKINEMLYDKKVMDFLKNTLKINDKFISHEDFVKKSSEAMQ